MKTHISNKKFKYMMNIFWRFSKQCRLFALRKKGAFHNHWVQST